MMKNFAILATLILMAFSSQAQPAKHVVLISIDGLRPDFYQDPSWNAINLRQLKENGVYAQGVQSVFPSFTYPSHTAIITGALPIRHGVYYNVYFEPFKAPGRWYWNESEIKVPTLWDAVGKAGLTSAAVHWPVSVGAPVTYNLPEVWAWPSTKKVLLEEIAKNAHPAGLMEEVQQNATGRMEELDYNSYYLSADENMARISGYLIRKYKPSLLAVHLTAVDHFEHEQGRDGDKVRRAVASADRAVRTILESIERAGLTETTAVMIVGDHGFSDIHTALYPNIWLRDNGFATPSQDGAEQQWSALFHPCGGSAFLHLKNKNDKATLQKVKDILNRLPEAQKRQFRIVDRKELDSIGADPNAALALAAVQGVSFSGSDKGKESVRAAKGGTHGFFPDFKEIQTGFIGYGAGFKKGAVLPVMGLQDIAPIVATLLGIPFEAPDGILYPGILDLSKK